jgi:hypothetical protein
VNNLNALKQELLDSQLSQSNPPSPDIVTSDVDLSAFNDLLPSVNSRTNDSGARQTWRFIAYTTGGSDSHQSQVAATAGSYNPVGQVIKIGRARSNLVMFTQPNQVASGFVSGNNETCITGTPGTFISTDKNAVVLHTGRLLADNDKQKMIVFTNEAAVIIEPQAAAVIETHPGAPVRVMSLAGTGESPIIVRTRDGSAVKLLPGHEVVIGQTDLTDADLLPIDGLNRNSGTTRVTAKVAKDNFSLSEFALHEPLSKTHPRLQGHIAAAARKQSPNNELQLDKMQITSNGEPARILGDDNTEFTIQKSGQLKLSKGTLFVHSNDELAIATPLAEVHDTKGVALGLVADNGKTRIQVLSGTKPVSVVAAKHIMPLKCGKEILITNHKPTQKEAVPADEVGRRGMSAIALGDGMGAVLGDFSIFSVLTGAKHMLPLTQPSSLAEQRIHAQILKSAAVVQQVFGGRGRYYVAPKEEAKSPIPDWVFKTTADFDDGKPLLKAMLDRQ